MSKSTATIHPYIHFTGRCEEAIKYYQSALGAEVVLQMRFKESPEPPPPGCLPPGFENKIMHAQLRIGEAVLMVTDGPDSQDPKPREFQGISINLSVATEAEATKYFNGLAKQGKVLMPLAKTFFSPLFGIVADPFGIKWMIYTKPAA